MRHPLSTSLFRFCYPFRHAVRCTSSSFRVFLSSSARTDIDYDACALLCIFASCISSYAFYFLNVISKKRYVVWLLTVQVISFRWKDAISFFHVLVSSPCSRRRFSYVLLDSSMLAFSFAGGYFAFFFSQRPQFRHERRIAAIVSRNVVELSLNLHSICRLASAVDVPTASSVRFRVLVYFFLRSHSNCFVKATVVVSFTFLFLKYIYLKNNPIKLLSYKYIHKKFERYFQNYNIENKIQY